MRQFQPGIFFIRKQNLSKGDSHHTSLEKQRQSRYLESMNINTGYKNSVFSFLFNNPETLRELYGAIEGVVLPPDTPIDINTLSGVLYMDQLNDLSFTIGNLLVVIMEHQSTINPNMPLRLLMYIAHIYEKIVNRSLLYGSKFEKIPTPEFIVLYNGKERYPDRSTLRLSDAFKDACGLLGVENPAPSLELVVQVYNINSGHNTEILKKSRTLGGYSAFVGKVREYAQNCSKEEAMKKAIKYCMDNDILKTFLETHGSEVTEKRRRVKRRLWANATCYRAQKDPQCTVKVARL